MKFCLVVTGILCLIALSLSAPTQANNQNNRQKRVSDQRLAELETMLALAQMKNRKYMSLPVGFGLIDVQQIGRRKRSSSLSPLTQLFYSRDLNEVPTRSVGVALKGGEYPVRSGASSVPFASPLIVDSLAGWDRKVDPSLAFVQDSDNYV